MDLHGKANPLLGIGSALPPTYVMFWPPASSSPILISLHPDTFFKVTLAPVSPWLSFLSVEWTTAHKYLEIPQEHCWQLLYSLTFSSNRRCLLWYEEKTTSVPSVMLNHILHFLPLLCILTISQPPALKSMEGRTGTFCVQGANAGDTQEHPCSHVTRNLRLGDAFLGRPILWENQEWSVFSLTFSYTYY